jgi:hypothetical protein
MAPRAKVARQKVIIELSNGKKGVFEGTAIAWEDDIDVVSITNVVFQTPTLGNPRNVTPAKEAPPPKEAPKPDASQSKSGSTPEKPSA